MIEPFYKDNVATIFNADCKLVMRAMEENSLDAIVCDPPYGLEFMGEDWDKLGAGVEEDAKSAGGFGKDSETNENAYAAARIRYGKSAKAMQEWHHAWAVEALRVLKPGGYLLAFGGNRTYHRLACGIEDAGFEVRDMLDWLYGCLSEDTEILVNGRWEPYHKATEGNLALCYNMDEQVFTLEPIQELLVYDYDDTAYRVTSERTDQIISRNHRCIVDRGNGWEFYFAEEAAREREICVPVMEDLRSLLNELSNGSLSSENGSSASQEPRPTGQPKGEPSTVCQQQRPQAVRGARHASADMARIEPFHYIGKVWCVRVPTGAFVARRNGKVFITGNSGFPKSLDVSKAIDELLGAEREVVGINPTYRKPQENASAFNLTRNPNLTAPATDEAKEWEDWRTALKPGKEPICMARKPLSEKNVALNVLRWGTGAINIGDCRIGWESQDEYEKQSARTEAPRSNIRGGKLIGSEPGKIEPTSMTPAGRFPPNVLLDEEAARMLDEQSGELRSGATPTVRRADKFRNVYSAYGGQMEVAPVRDASSGGASRFFYVAKASKSERRAYNEHPTVKPVAMMKYLVMLVTRPGATVFDPFTGSGTTGVAAIQAGRYFVGSDDKEEYCKISAKRIAEQNVLGIF